MQVPQTEDPITTTIWSALERERESQPPRAYLGMSGIGKKCERMLWFDFRQYTPKPIEGRALAIFAMGDDVEARIKQYLELAGYRVSDEQLGFQDLDGLFRGHCDGTVEGVTRRRHILECKSANDRHFQAFKQAGLRATWPEYYCQVQCYMGYSGLERALVVVQNKNNADLHTERVRFVAQDFYALRARALGIILTNTPPDPAYKDGARECEWCHQQIMCRRPSAQLQRWASCGNCLRLSIAECPESGGVALLCAKHGAIPREFWGQTGCGSWEFNDCTVPF